MRAAQHGDAVDVELGVLKSAAEGSERWMIID